MPLWSDHDINILKQYYPTGESLACIPHLEEKRGVKAIATKARHMGIKSLKYNKWSPEEDQLLKDNWDSATKETLNDLFPKHTYESLCLRACKLGLSANNRRKRKGSFDFLNSLTENSIYWWGFIMADGCLSERGLIISLSTKDSDHLDKLRAHLILPKLRFFTNFKGYSKEKGSDMCALHLDNKKWATEWRSKLKISSAKTYTPPDLSLFLTPENFIYFMIGFIDGDGSIWLSRKYPNIRVEVHPNWMPQLEVFSKLLLEFYNIESRTRFTLRGYAQLIIKKQSMSIFFEYVKKVDYLERKWSKIFHIA